MFTLKLLRPLSPSRRIMKLAPLAAALLLSGALPLSAQKNDEGGKVNVGEFQIPREMNERFRTETQMVMNYMSSRHYGDKGLGEIDPKELLDAYIKELDYAKLFFIQEDIDSIHLRFADTLKREYMNKGNLYPAFEIYRTYRERSLNRLAWVFKRLEGDFDFCTEETFRPDRKDVPWPKDMAEADKLWENRLVYEMLDGVINGEDIDTVRARLVHRYERTERFLKEIEPHEVEEMFLNSFTTLFDPHSNFFSVESADNFAIAISNSLQGIGAVLSSEDGYCVIRELMSGGPAELSGQLNPGDKIVAVAQGKDEPVDVVDMKLTKAVKLIRGPKGSEVRLTIVPADNPTARHVVRIIRDEIRLTENLASGMLIEVPSLNGGEPVPVGVIDLPSFYGPGMDEPDAPSTTRDVQELLIKLQAAGAKAIVLDLRRNGGGLLSEAISMTGLFIKDGPVVQVRYDNGKTRTDFDDDNGFITYDGPLVVLVSRNSASASEICAGAFQVLKRGVVIGDKTTHGKGTVQQTMLLNRMMAFRNPFASNIPLGMLKITVQKFYLPDGASTQKEGVKSDIVLPNINELLPIGESDLDHALPWDSIEPTKWNQEKVFTENGARVSEELLSALSANTAQRLETLPEFKYLNDNIERFRIKDEQKDISLNKEKRIAEREDDKAFRNRMEDWRNDLRSSDAYPHIKVDLELARLNEATHQQQLRDTLLPDGRQRAGSYYQKIYYHQDDMGHIHPVRVEAFNYETVLRRSEEVTEVISKALGKEISNETTQDILRAFRNSDLGTDFNVDKVFGQYLPELGDEQLDALLPLFYAKLVEIDPDAVDESDRFDVPLREAARVAADWVSLQ